MTRRYPLLGALLLGQILLPGAALAEKEQAPLLAAVATSVPMTEQDREVVELLELLEILEMLRDLELLASLEEEKSK
jgi:hypothetical protein